MSYRAIPVCPKCGHRDSYYVPSNLGDIWFCPRPDCKTEFDSYTKEVLVSLHKEKKPEVQTNDV